MNVVINALILPFGKDTYEFKKQVADQESTWKKYQLFCRGSEN